MVEAGSTRLTFGTVAALFETGSAAQAAAEALARQGYPRELITVLTGAPWEDGAVDASGLVPDPELAVRLVPASPADTVARRESERLDARLAAFSGSLLTEARRRRSHALWPVLTFVGGVVVTMIVAALTRAWAPTVVVGLTAFHVFVIALILTYARARVITFPFRGSIGAADEVLKAGGALVTVRSTLPYRSLLEQRLTEAGGTVLGYARDTVYPVPA